MDATKITTFLIENPTFLALALLAIVAICWVKWKNDPHLERLDKSVEDIKASVKHIEDAVVALTGKSISQSNSPITLTRFGHSLYKSIDAKSIVEKHYKSIEIDKDDSAYQIQEKCFQFATEELIKLLSVAELKQINDVAYKEVINRDNMMKEVVGISMRDKVLIEYGKNPVEEPVEEKEA